MKTSFSFSGTNDLKSQLSQLSKIPTMWESITFWDSTAAPDKGFQVVFEFGRVPGSPTYVKRWYCEGKYTDTKGFSDAVLIDIPLHHIVPFENLIKDVIQDIEVAYKRWIQLNSH